MKGHRFQSYHDVQHQIKHHLGMSKEVRRQTKADKPKQHSGNNQNRFSGPFYISNNNFKYKACRCIYKFGLGRKRVNSAW